jgi:hypothetical protein
MAHGRHDHVEVGQAYAVYQGCSGPVQEQALGDRQDVDCWFAFLDPSSLPSNPGWPLRNLLYRKKRLMHASDGRIMARLMPKSAWLESVVTDFM